VPSNSEIDIRREQPGDFPAIDGVTRAAFGSSAEAALVAALREQARPIVSMVADAGGEIVGHIMFSPVTLIGHPDLDISGLAPMAVRPGWQRRGIGSRLVRAGLERCRDLGFRAVVVLGHPEFYPRFGFAPASRFGIRSEYDVPDDVFMSMELVAGALRNRSGTIRYHPAFAAHAE
jgi:putative acetyltransferase